MVVGWQGERGWETGENIVTTEALRHGSAKVAGGRLTKWVAGNVTARERKLREPSMRGPETIGRKSHF